jgi:hypothetical protein
MDRQILLHIHDLDIDFCQPDFHMDPDGDHGDKK